jgi:signal transduction histidine kinase
MVSGQPPDVFPPQDENGGAPATARAGAGVGGVGDSRIGDLDLATAIAHELRNSLQVAATHAFLLRRSATSLEPHLGKIETHLAHAQRVVSDLLQLAYAPERGEEVAVSEVWTRAASSFDAMAVACVGETHARITTRPALLERLFAILIDNAGHASAKRLCLAIEADAHGHDGETVLWVIDDGAGVTGGDPLATPRYSSRGSTGIGLVLAQRIARALDGEFCFVARGTAPPLAPPQALQQAAVDVLTAERPEGLGATFRIRVPSHLGVASAPAPQASHVEASASRGR